ncbi:SDR family oxidoreductase [Microcoleus sp. FACHB-1515]|uniref:SDR family oxidoreductase n=1 Tax=Cyanophyceae TaxID=3028117 RepID=UPI0016893853|nr:SDR family oxidoreductase [Microcoleus sp. FACHB-1515]MBD2088918.1 SDR family oxidoreductase [Microcoleus sp. FACHB-1515]
MASRIFLAGASRGVGRELTDRLVRHSLAVTALLRSEFAADELRSIGVNLVMGDALLSDQVEAALASEPFDAVISTIGGLSKDGLRSDYLGNKNLIDAAVKAGIQRFILVSSIGSGNSAVALPPQALQTLGAVLAEKAQAEQHLVASGLTYTILRPGGLKSEPATGNGVLTLDPTVAGSIHRADVADLACRCLLSERSHNQIFSVIDRTLVYGQPDFAEYSL